MLLEGREKVSYLRDARGTDFDFAGSLRQVGLEHSWQSSVLFQVNTVGGVVSLDPTLQDEAFEMAKEAVTNAFRHSEAARIVLDVIYGRDQFSWLCRDDGKGLDPEILKRGGRDGHWGLVGMRERAESIGATIRFHSEAGRGTEVLMRIPARRAYTMAAPFWFKLRSHKGPVLRRLS